MAITKTPDRRRPFQRINNDEFVQATPPDGKGVPCGCHTPDEIGTSDKDFEDFVQKELGALGTILNFVENIASIARTAATAAIATATAVAAAFAAIPGLGAGPAAPLAAAIAAITAVIAVVNFVSEVLDVIRSVIRFFFVKIVAKLAKRATRVIPQWTPVDKGTSDGKIPTSQIREIEGIALRSFGNPIEAPFFQWHTWMNWSVQVRPESKYKNLIPAAGNGTNSEGMKPGERLICPSDALDIQWDTGAMMEGFDNPFETGFEPDKIEENDGPFTKGIWLWPTAGMFVWASGRWVYDCRRTDSTTQKDPRMVSMINPPRAMATATFEAFQFAENLGDANSGPTRTPAILFQFFACKRGGYMSYDTLADKDYEFIVDLPPGPSPAAPFPIGHTTEFIHNTIVCRPRLLQATLNLPFAGARAIKPLVEPIPTGKPGEAFKQAKVTITKASLDGADAAGFILALGWHDPNLVQAKTVRVARVSFSGMEGRLRVRDNPVAQLQEMFKEELDEARAEITRRVAGIRILGFSLNDIPVVTDPITGTRIDLGGELRKLVRVLVDAAFDALLGELAKLVTNNLESEEWLMRYGVNGRWEARYFHEMTNKPFALKRPAEFEVSLGPDDVLFFTTSGVELNPVGDMMRAGRTERELKLADSPALTWNEIVTATGTKRRDIVFRYAFNVFKGNSKGPLLALGIENTPLGIVDPNFDRADNVVETSNPLIVSKAELGSVSRKAVARFARATGEQCILVEQVQGNDDYRVNMLIQISNQVKS